MIAAAKVSFSSSFFHLLYYYHYLSLSLSLILFLRFEMVADGGKRSRRFAKGHGRIGIR